MLKMENGVEVEGFLHMTANLLKANRIEVSISVILAASH
jgi:hypothetical protein